MTIELEHKSIWAMKKLKMHLNVAAEQRLNTNVTTLKECIR